ncbi:BadF/BadG/BcrA/BcrD ATPase family protein [Microbacterium sp. NPDC019599]|uniref:N-acetylglucosamine kinase n=1 Tax=Microbacterium sp. NPDC019599 TaxID=3154690 RepID=UPI0033C2FB84
MTPDAAIRVLAVDGGQSAVRVRHSSGGAAEVPGISWHGPRTLEATAAAIVEAWRVAGAPLVHAAVLGLTTVPDEEGCAHLAGLVAEELGADRIVVCDDGVTTHAGAFAGDWGVALSVGTGVACATRGPADAAPVLLGGHGYLLGDEGGAYWIGRGGVAAALRAADGRGPSSTLVSAAESRFGAVRGIPIRLHSSERAVDEIAHFAPEVLAAARAGDPVAAAIVDEAVDELALLARVARPAGAQVATPLVILGRLGADLAPQVVDRLNADPGAFDARVPLGDALDGAMLLAHSPAGNGLHVWTRG